MNSTIGERIIARFRSYHLRNYDFGLIALLCVASAIGVLAVGSARPDLQTRQLAGALVGIAGMVIVSMIDYHFILKFAWVIYFLALLLLGAVLVSPTAGTAGGAQRWLNIGGLRFQPSEVAKIAIILFFAYFIMKHRKRLNTFRYIAASTLLFAVPALLVYKQPDMSTTIIMVLLFCVIMFLGGLSYRLIAVIIAVAAPVALVVLALLVQPNSILVERGIINSYQQRRILAFFNPQEYETNEAYQQLNSVTAIGSGQLEGKGYKNNEVTSVKNGHYISQPQTDFVFTVIGEEFGFRGSVLTVGVLVFIALECFRVAGKASDIAGFIIAGGMGTLVIFQSFLNIGVATFIVPNTGLPLPFISYGLTSVVSLYLGMGVVLNVRLQAVSSFAAQRQSIGSSFEIG